MSITKFFSLFYFIIFFLLSFQCIGLETQSASLLKFEVNKGQWNKNVIYKSDLKGGRLFLEESAFTYVFYSLSDLEQIHEKSHEATTPILVEQINQSFINCHAFKVKFLGAKPISFSGENKLSSYHNYFIGNDKNKWASNVDLFTGVSYKEMYSGIDLNVYSKDLNLKYDFVVNPFSSADVIRLEYTGVNQVYLKEGQLIIQTSVTDIIEQKPYAYQMINGVEVPIECNYVLENQIISFSFPKGYNKGYPLVIDPIVVASTYSGSTATTYGHCATYDNSGNIYTGGRCFGVGYPATTGAFQTLFGGSVDIVISKLNSSGSSLLYATYIGGSFDEYSQSMYVNSNDELFIYGSCGSTDYPTTTGCYDSTFNGGYDIMISKINSQGTVLLSSTFIGGYDNDGYNLIYHNYGDSYRGEIVVDGSSNVYVASFTSSVDFPTTNMAYQQSYNGGAQDACVFKLNDSLTTLGWSTYLGGDNEDAAYGIRIDSNGDVYVVGGTASTNFPMTSASFPAALSALSKIHQGGTYDGFIVKLQLAGAWLGASTFFGTSSFDEIFFIDLDASDNVYLYGLTEGTITPTAGVYSNLNSSQFITKLNPSLTTIIYSTLFGSGNSTAFSPTAFLVDICEQVYVAGWGSTTGFPVSANAIQSVTDGSDFYLMVLEKDAVGLLYATYYGDLNSWEHVDGGTSRFDKKGIVYGAICEGGLAFPTTSTAYSPSNLASSWDIAVFKIDFQSVGVIAKAVAAPSDTGCAPFAVNFTNNSISASNFIWDFGDGSSIDTNAVPSHIFTTAGIYSVKLIAIDSMSCNFSDTSYITITVTNDLEVNLGSDTTLCDPAALVLDAENSGATYSWSTGASTPSIIVNTDGSYWVEVNNGSCNKTDTILITFMPTFSVGQDTSTCEGDTVILDAGNTGNNYLWSTGETTQNINITNSGTYWVQVSLNTCEKIDTITVTVNSLPQVFLGNDTVLCPETFIMLDAGNNGSEYYWSTGDTMQMINVVDSGEYWVNVNTNGCDQSDTIIVNAASKISLGSDTSLCDQEEIILDAKNSGATYIWNTGQTTQSITVLESGTYWVEALLGNCYLKDTIEVSGVFGSSNLYFPNTFTPNQDGLNDIFTGYGEDIIFFQLKIFNRWGNLYYESSGIENGWNGEHNGSPVESGVYVWMVDFSSQCTGGDIVHKMGDILISR